MADNRDIINTLIAEALGEGPEGMRRVAETINNRALIRGLTPEQVVTQPFQYTGYSNPGPAAVRAMSDPNAISAAEAAWRLAQQPGDPTNGADHYFNPNVVRPNWAQSMTPTGDYGGHSFFSSRAVPQQPKVAPTPATASTGLSATRANTSPSGGNTALQSALARLATVRANAVTPATKSAFNGDPLTPSNGPLISTVPTRSQFNGDPLTPVSGNVVATIPTRSAGSASDRVRGNTPMNSLTTGGRAPIGLSQPGNLNLNGRSVYSAPDGSYRTENSISIGTDQGEVLIPTIVNGRQVSEQAAIDNYTRTGQNLGTFKTPQAADKYAEQLHNRQEQFYSDPGTRVPIDVVASIPTTNTNKAALADAARRAALSIGSNQTYAGQDRATTTIGKAPTTRTVQSVVMPPITPVRAVSSTPARAVPLTIGAQSSYAGQDRAVTARPTVLPTQSQLVAATGFTGPVPNRLPTGFNIPNTTNARGIAGVGTNAVAPIAYARPANLSPQTAVASALSTRQAPVPATMPAGLRTPVAQVAPVAAPRVAQALMAPQAMPAPTMSVVVNGGNPIARALSAVQQSPEWQRVTGTEPRYTDNGNGSRTSASGGVYYDRNYK